MIDHMARLRGEIAAVEALRAAGCIDELAAAVIALAAENSRLTLQTERICADVARLMAAPVERATEGGE